MEMDNEIDSSFSLNSSIMNSSSIGLGKNTSSESQWFISLQLLGFDEVNQQKTHGIEFDSKMFKKSNEKGMQVIFYFLFTRLESKKIKEIFSSVWPIYDRNQAREFKKIICTRLLELEKQGKLPPNTTRASDFQTCSGPRFYALLDHFSTLVIKTKLERDFAYPIPPILKNEIEEPKSILEKSQTLQILQIHIRRESLKFIEKAKKKQQVTTLWKEFEIHLQNETEKVNECLKLLQAESQQLANQMKSNNIFSEEAELNRSLKAKEIEEMWNRVKNRCNDKSKIEMLSNTMHKRKHPNSLEQKKLMFNLPKIPNSEMLQKEINQIEMFEEEKLSLESLVKTWNISSQSIQKSISDQFQSPQISVLRSINSKLSQLLDTHKAYESSLRSRNFQLSETITKMKNQIKQQTEQISSLLPEQNTKQEYGLLPPTPVSQPSILLNTPKSIENFNQYESPYKTAFIDFNKIIQSVQRVATRGPYSFVAARDLLKDSLNNNTQQPLSPSGFSSKKSGSFKMQTTNPVPLKNSSRMPPQPKALFQEEEAENEQVELKLKNSEKLQGESNVQLKWKPKKPTSPMNEFSFSESSFFEDNNVKNSVAPSISPSTPWTFWNTNKEQSQPKTPPQDFLNDKLSEDTKFQLEEDLTQFDQNDLFETSFSLIKNALYLNSPSNIENSQVISDEEILTEDELNDQEEESKKKQDQQFDFLSTSLTDLLSGLNDISSPLNKSNNQTFSPDLSFSSISQNMINENE